MKLTKRIIAILICALMLLSLVACGGTQTDTSSETGDTSADTSTNSDTGSTETNTDTQKPSDSNKPSDTESDTDTSAGGDKPSDTDVPSDTDTDKPNPDKPNPDEPKPDEPTDTNDGTDTDQITPEPEPEPEPEPTKPEPQTLNIIKDGKSDYVIVYKNNTISKKYAEQLKAHIAEKYGVTLHIYNERKRPDTLTHEIIVGNVSACKDLKYVRNEIGDANDFAITVLGDDLVLYAPNDYLFGYMTEIAKKEIFTGGSELTIKPEDSITLATSKYKDQNYAEYLKAQGNINYDKLLILFEENTYMGSDGTELPYRIYVPSDYDPSKLYPVVTILHGAGERGSDNQAQLKNMVAALFNQKDSKYIDAIIVCPQCPAGQQWVDTPWANGNYSVDSLNESNELKTAFELVEWTKYNLSTDHNRYYMMGLSMGGFGTWDMIMRHRDSFTAAVALCGGADVSYAEYLKDFPIWAVHSSNDYSVPYAGTQAMCQALENAGSTVYTFETKSSGHNVWGYAGSSTEIADWLFSQGVTE